MDEKGIEEKLNKISFGDNNTIVISKCEIKQVILGENNNIEVQIDNIECRFDELESMIDDLESNEDD